MHINEGKGKLALFSMKDNVLLTPHPYYSSAIDLFSLLCISHTTETIGLPRLARALLTVIGSCRIYSIFKIKAGRFRKHYPSCNRFSKETICSSSLVKLNSVINKTRTLKLFNSIYLFLHCAQYFTYPSPYSFLFPSSSTILLFSLLNVFIPSSTILLFSLLILEFPPSPQY